MVFVKGLNGFVLFSYIYSSTLITQIFAHTWVESANLIGLDGFFQDVGYARGFSGRGEGVNPDDINTHLIPPNGRTLSEILPTDRMCKYGQINNGTNLKFPRLSASPNDQISLKYLENGHVTRFHYDKRKPAGRGTVFIYGTRDSSPNDTYLGIHRVWNAQGTEGNSRGRLLATRPFDDGRCYQQSHEDIAQRRAHNLGFADGKESPEVECQATLRLPSDAGNNGTYTIYWVWEWPTLDKYGKISQNESYTSCIDINMMKKSELKSTLKTSNEKSRVIEPSVNSFAIKSQLEGKNQFMVDPNAPPKLAPDDLARELISRDLPKKEPKRKNSIKSLEYARNYRRETKKGSINEKHDNEKHDNKKDDNEKDDNEDQVKPSQNSVIDQELEIYSKTSTKQNFSPLPMSESKPRSMRFPRRNIHWL